MTHDMFSHEDPAASENGGIEHIFRVATCRPSGPRTIIGMLSVAFGHGYQKLGPFGPGGLRLTSWAVSLTPGKSKNTGVSDTAGYLRKSPHPPAVSLTLPRAFAV
jgi:hypothetical protein